MTSTPCCDLALARAGGCRRAPPTRMPCSCACSTTSGGGGPSALTSIDTGCASATSTWPGPSSSTPSPAAFTTPASSVVGQRRDAVLVEQLLDELPGAPAGIIVVEAASRLASAPPPLPTYFAGITMSTPYGLPSTCSSIQFSSISSWSGLKRERAEHAEAAGLADRGDDVAAVREGEDRELDPETVTDRCAHGGPPAWLGRVTCARASIRVAEYARPRTAQGLPARGARRCPTHSSNATATRWSSR